HARSIFKKVEKDIHQPSHENGLSVVQFSFAHLWIKSGGIMAHEKFYLGRLFNEKTAKVTGDALEYDSADLTTHAVVTGMTGSGKTGLCVALLEEAALHGIPAIIIDPKGDLTNLLLHFPELLPQDFQPW